MKSTTTKTVYNLIILDRSGSMGSIASEAIAGVNETVGTIRAAGKATGMEQRVSIVTFCGCSTSYFCRNVDVDDVPVMTGKDYRPCCSTPLCDAMGGALTALRESVSQSRDAAVSVTIITDGYENASTDWSGESVKALVSLLKADGWLFAYIGANQDVESVSFSLSIDNAMAFKATAGGTKSMFERERSARRRWMDMVKDGQALECATGYFDDINDETDLSDR